MSRLPCLCRVAALALFLLPLAAVSADEPAGSAAADEAPAAAPGNLTLTVSSAPPPLREGVASTRDPQVLSVVTMVGETVTLALSSGRDYTLGASGGWFWTRFDALPEQAEFVQLTPRRLADGTLVVKVEQSRKEGTRLRRFTSTVAAARGEWTRLWGPAEATEQRVLRFGTRTLSGDALYLMVQ